MKEVRQIKYVEVKMLTPEQIKDTQFVIKHSSGCTKFVCPCQMKLTFSKVSKMYEPLQIKYLRCGIIQGVCQYCGNVHWKRKEK